MHIYALINTRKCTCTEYCAYLQQGVLLLRLQVENRRGDYNDHIHVNLRDFTRDFTRGGGDDGWGSHFPTFTFYITKW